MVTSEKVLATFQTSYDQYQIIERSYEGRPARVLFSGTKRAAQSAIGLDDDPDLLFDYNQRLLELANAVYPTRILIIGGGAFTLPMALLAALPEAQIDVVELDSGLDHAARQYFGLQDDPRLRITYGDGRAFLQQTSASYDLIIIDVFSELAIPKRFLTVEWCELLSRRVTPSGTIGFNFITSIRGKNSGLIRSQIAAYSRVFPRLDVFPAAYGLTGWLPQNLILVAQTSNGHNISPFMRYAPIEPITISNDDIRYD